MSYEKSVMLAVVVAAFIVSPAHAKSGEGRPTPEQMKIIHECAAKKGVDLPEPPGPPPKGGKQGGAETPPPEGANNGTAGGPPPDGVQSKGDGKPQGMEGKGDKASGKGPRHPMLTDEQKAVIDECFKENGITPPKPMGPPSGKGNGLRADEKPATDKAE